jgi:hypothetical protein
MRGERRCYFGYRSQGEAEFAGERALEEFLVELSKEERRRR